MQLCRRLGKTLGELRSSVTEKELQLWYTLELVEADERKQAELNQEVAADFAENKGRFTNGF